MTSGPVLRRARFGRVSDPHLSVGCPGSPGGRVGVPPGGPGGPSEERRPGTREVEAGRGVSESRPPLPERLVPRDG